MKKRMANRSLIVECCLRLASPSRFARTLSVLMALAAAGAVHADDPALDTPAQKEAPTAFAAKEPKPVLTWGKGNDKSYVIPAAEILSFEYLLNRVDHYFVDSSTYGSPTSDLSQNFNRKWIVDNDKFATNQFLHPYQGSMYQGFARSAGLNFWQASAYTFAGSVLWEESGEHTKPSINDQVASGISGNLLGEPLFRLASLLLESGGDGNPGIWRELGAAAISPATGINRLAFGDRFGGVFRSHDPAVFTRVDLGATLNTHFSSNVNVNTDPVGPPAEQTLKKNEASADLTVAYGLPGKPGYTYTRPFDYFSFEFKASTSNTFENVFSNGLLYGTDYEIGKSYRGIWGLYGTYSYVEPQIFKVSTTAASLGTTAQWWVSRKIALQGSALAGLGYGGGGVVHGAGIAPPGANGDGQRDYHYGLAPQELLALRMVIGDRVSIDTTARDYYISGLASTEHGGSENIIRADIGVTLRVYNLHGLTLRYSESQRDGRYSDRPASHQKVGAVSIGYTLLGQDYLGTVDWRPAEDGGPEPNP